MAIKKTIALAVEGKKGKVVTAPVVKAVKRGKQIIEQDEPEGLEEHEARVQERQRALKIVWTHIEKEPANIREMIAAKQIEVSERFVNSGIRWARRFKLFVQE